MNLEHPWVSELIYQSRLKDQLARAEQVSRLREVKQSERAPRAARAMVGVAMVRAGSRIAGTSVRAYLDGTGHLAIDC